MEEHKVHTSVVIELGTQEESDGQNMYKIDFDDVNPPKDYVIDQIFCGENITVYALFEISDVTSRESDKQLVDVKHSTSNEEYRFYHRNSYKKAKNETRFEGRRSSSMMDSEEEIQFPSGIGQRNESLYCLKHFEGSYEVSSGGDENSDLKVLFTKDVIKQNTKSTKFKAVSRGVNTDIAQSPKLLEEVEKAIGLNLTGAKTNGVTEITVTEPVTRQTSSNFSSEMEIKLNKKKSSPNFVLVPIIMTEETIMNQFRKDDKVYTISSGTNTDPFEYYTCEDKEKNEENISVRSYALESLENAEKIEKPKLKLKETILEEIRSLQWKLNALIKSIESNNLSELLQETSTDVAIPTTMNETEQLDVMEPEPIRRNQMKFDDLPIFSSVNVTPHLMKTPLDKTSKKSRDIEGNEKKEYSVLSISSVNLISGSCSSASQITRTNEKQKPKGEFKNGSEEINYNRGPGVSRSESNIRSTGLEAKHAPPRMSLSFHAREEKLNRMKKTKSTFKYDSGLSINTNMRNKETCLGDSLTVVNCEMGDEAPRKPLQLFLTIDERIEKEGDFKENKNDLKEEKNQNEEDDESKITHHGQKTHKFVSNTEKTYCNTNTSASDAVMKTAKISAPSKARSRNVEKSIERGMKVCSDSEKTPTVGGNYKKWNLSETIGRNEAKISNKTISRNKVTEKGIKPERRDITIVQQQKTVSGCRKFSLRSGAESKLHVDKLIRKADAEPKVECNNLRQYQAGGKGDTSNRSSRPPSQKRDRPEATPAAPNAISTKNSLILMQQTKFKEKGTTNVKDNGDGVTEFDGKETNENIKLSPDTSSVVFELYSKKPTSMEDLSSEFEQENMCLENPENDGKNHEKDGNACDTFRKPIVKSVWALTKVLLYEDGTRKFEILEASSTPPGYSFKGTDKSAIGVKSQLSQNTDSNFT